MPPEQAALWHMIRENPHDDAPRLIYSDWLEEHDQAERAEFIRRHIADSNAIREGVIDNFTMQNRRACRALFLEHQLEWWNPPDRNLEHFPFSRGFPSPSVHYWTYSENSGKLASDYIWMVPEWRLFNGNIIEAIDLNNDLSQSFFRSVVSQEFNELINPSRLLNSYLKSPNFKNLWRLSFENPGDFVEFLKLIFETPMPGQLRDLSIGEKSYYHRLFNSRARGANFNLSELESSASKTQFPNLYSLRIAGYSLQDHELLQIDRIFRLKNMSILKLQGNLISAKGIECFVTDESPRLIGLNLSTNRIGDEGAIRIARSPSMSRLRFLILKGNQIGPDGLRALLDSPVLQRKTHCVVDDNPGLADPEIDERFKEWQSFAKTYIA